MKNNFHKAGTNPRRTAAVPLFSWGGLMSPLFWVVLLTSLVLALLTPDAFVQNSISANNFAQFIRNHLLQISQHADINAHAQSTAFPHAALLSHAFMWTGMAILLVFNTCASAVNWKFWMEWLIGYQSGLSRKQRKALLIMPLAVLIFAFVFSMLPGSTQIVRHADLHSRLYFSLLTGAVIFLWQIATYGWLPVFHIIISEFSQGRK